MPADITPNAPPPSDYDYEADLADWCEQVAAYFEDIPRFMRELADELETDAVTHLPESADWLRTFAGALPDVTEFMREIRDMFARGVLGVDTGDG